MTRPVFREFRSILDDIHDLLTFKREFAILLRLIHDLSMATSSFNQFRLKTLKEEYDKLRPGKDSLLKLLDESEISESVYNSNAIENSTLTLKQTEKILMEMELSKDLSLREVFEAKNLARVIEYIRAKSAESELNKEIMLFLHQMLIGGIDDGIAGRFRAKMEYVRVGSHIAPAPEQIQPMLDRALFAYAEFSTQSSNYFIDRVALFHLEFERIHPFNDGNGRMGRVITNWQLQKIGFPPVIIRNKEKQNYYDSFKEYDGKRKTEIMEQILTLALMESLNKRIAYLAGKEIVTLAEYSKSSDKSLSALLNMAKRQTIPAFREKGVWMIGA